MTFLLATRLASHRVACNSRCCTSLLLLLLFFAASFLRHTRTNLINTKSSTRAETEPSPSPPACLCCPLPPHWPCNWCVNPHIDSGYCGGFCWKYAPGRASRASRASRARQSYSQWRICCRDSLMLRVYGLLKGFAHCILSSFGHRLSNLITLRHWNYCNMLYCRQHSQCECACVCEWFYWPDESVLISQTCVCLCVRGSKSPTAHSTR